MKKVLFAVTVVLVLLWTCGSILAQGAGRGAGQEKPAEGVRAPGRARRPDANDPYRRAKGMEVRSREIERERMDRRMAERLKMREERIKERERARKELGIELPEGELGQGKGFQKQVEAVKKQMVHEEQKHLRRFARLKRIRGLAAKESATVTRVENLIRKEQRRYDLKRGRMDRRLHTLTRLQGRKQVRRPFSEKGLRRPPRKGPRPRGYVPRNKSERKNVKQDTGEKTEE